MIEYNHENLRQICTKIIAIAKNAGDEILKHYNASNGRDPISFKIDKTPITTADIVAHKIITQELNNLVIDNTTFNLPILSEEDADINYSTRRQWTDYWLIDPLDGTKEYIDKSGEFCVNIALISNKIPIIGVIYAPYFKTLYYAINGHGSYKIEADNPVEKISVNKCNEHNLIINIVSSRRHHKISKYNDFISLLKQKKINYNILHQGSAIKFGLIAEGKADIYPRFGLTSEWDTAAGDCIIREAGGYIKTLSGERLYYNNKDSLLNPEFYAVGDPEFNWSLLIK